ASSIERASIKRLVVREHVDQDSVSVLQRIEPAPRKCGIQSNETDGQDVAVRFATAARAAIIVRYGNSAAPAGGAHRIEETSPWTSTRNSTRAGSPARCRSSRPRSRR